MKNIEIKEKMDIDLSSLDREVSFSVKENAESWLYLFNYRDDISLSFDLAPNSILHLSTFAKEEVKNLNLHANVAKNAKFVVYFADFSTVINTSNVDINLNEEGASTEWHLASLAGENDKKEISVSAFHNAPNTFANVENYGVAKDDSRLVFSGTSHILNGSIKSKTHQAAKIMVFDPNSDAIAKPILKIDENDIEASHAAAVGKISDEQIFYLTSRGLSSEEAKMLITLGYLKPIFKGFDEDKVEHINETMGGRL